MRPAFALQPLSRRALALLLALAALGLAALPALAHADLVSSEPAAGATVPAGLNELRLTFSEPVGPGSGVVLFAEEFQPVAGVTSTTDGEVLNAVWALALGEGTYTVQWTAVSLDGHPVQGSYQFGVSAPIGAGLGPSIVFASSLIIGTLSLLALVVLARLRRR